MAKVQFERDEVRRAKEAGAPLLVFAVAGGPSPGFPYQGFAPGAVNLTPARAKEAIDWYVRFVEAGETGTTGGK